MSTVTPTPVASTPNTAIPAGDARRSIPVKDGNAASAMAYYEKIRKELRDMLAKKRALDKNLNNLEDHIYKLESSYLEETPNGNIIRGFDNYIKGNVSRRRNPISDSDRLFSQSSVTFMKDEQVPLSATTSVATPLSETAPKNTNRDKKKKRKKDDENETPSADEGGNKRARVSFST